MKATGIVRRIDDLGRVVVPKEIRDSQFIPAGTPMEIFTTSNGEIVLKPFRRGSGINEKIQILQEEIDSSKMDLSKEEKKEIQEAVEKLFDSLPKEDDM